jgi:hypothetical protein
LFNPASPVDSLILEPFSRYLLPFGNPGDGPGASFSAILDPTVNVLFPGTLNRLSFTHLHTFLMEFYTLQLI